jgi:hypothetical protein
MRHETTRSVFALWDSLRGHRVAPQRMDVTPAAFSKVLPDVFLLDGPDAMFRFRLAGSRLTAHLARPLTGLPFSHVWSPESAERVQHILSTVVEGVESVVCSLQFCEQESGSSPSGGRDRSVGGELILLPLRHEGRFDRRLLGAIAVTGDFPHTFPHPADVHIVSHRILARSVKPLAGMQLGGKIADCQIILRRGPLCLLDTGKQNETAKLHVFPTP